MLSSTYRQKISQTVGQLPIVGVAGTLHEFKPAELFFGDSHIGYGVENVVGLESKVLQTRSFVLLEEGLYLRLSSARTKEWRKEKY